MLEKPYLVTKGYQYLDTYPVLKEKLKEGFTDRHELAPSTFGISEEEKTKLEFLFEEYLEFYFAGFLASGLYMESTSLKTNVQNLLVFSLNHKDK